LGLGLGLRLGLRLRLRLRLGLRLGDGQRLRRTHCGGLDPDAQKGALLVILAHEPAAGLDLDHDASGHKLVKRTPEMKIVRAASCPWA
jgi:hypothetical protein